MLSEGKDARVSPSSAREQLERALAFGRRAARFRRPALALFLVGLAATAAFDLLRQRSYRSETILEYREPLRLAGSGGGEAVGDAPRKLAAQLKESLMSRVRLGRVIRELQLYPDRKEQDALDEMPRHLGFRASGDTFALSFESSSALTAQRVVTLLTAGLLEDDLAAQREHATQTRDFLVSESARNEAALIALEATAGRFMLRNPEFSQSGPVAASLVPAPTPSALDRPPEGRPPGDGAAYLAVQLEAVQLGPMAAQQAARVSRRQASATLEQATSRELAEQVARYTDTHPDVIAARSAHAKAAAALESATAEAAAGAAAALRERLTAVGKIAGRGGGEWRRSAAPSPPPPGTSEEARLVALATQWAQLSRDIADARERRSQLAQKLFLSSLKLSSVAAHLVVADPAYLPRDPLPPGHTQVAAIGLLCALLLALGLALGGAVLDDRLYGKSDLVRLGVGSFAEAMPDRDPSEIVCAYDWSATAGLPSFLRQLVPPPGSPQSASFRVLRFRLAAAGDPRIIVVASAAAGEGSTACAVNLAAAIAEQDQARVVLVDAGDSEQSVLQLGALSPAARGEFEPDTVDEEPALDQALSLFEPAARAAIPLRFLTLPPLHAGESLDGAAFARTCRTLLDGAYDYVVVAAPAVLASADANLIAQAADGVVIAARAGKSSSRAVCSAVEQLSPIRILGITLLPS